MASALKINVSAGRVRVCELQRYLGSHERDSLQSSKPHHRGFVSGPLTQEPLECWCFPDFYDTHINYYVIYRINRDGSYIRYTLLTADCKTSPS